MTFLQLFEEIFKSKEYEEYNKWKFTKARENYHFEHFLDDYCKTKGYKIIKK